MGGLSFIDQDRRAIRQIVVAIDLGRQPLPGRGLDIAADLGLVVVELADENRFEFVLSEQGQRLARLWRNDDDHAGSAA